MVSVFFIHVVFINNLTFQELAQRIKGYQEKIASLNSKCKMLAVKAKHATMLLTVTDVEGLPEELEEHKKKQSAQTVTVKIIL